MILKLWHALFGHVYSDWSPWGEEEIYSRSLRARICRCDHVQVTQSPPLDVLTNQSASTALQLARLRNFDVEYGGLVAGVRFEEGATGHRLSDFRAAGLPGGYPSTADFEEASVDDWAQEIGIPNSAIDARRQDIEVRRAKLEADMTRTLYGEQP